VNAIALSNDVSDLPYNTDRQGTQAISGIIYKTLLLLFGFNA